MDILRKLKNWEDPWWDREFMSYYYLKTLSIGELSALDIELNKRIVR